MRFFVSDLVPPKNLIIFQYIQCNTLTLILFIVWFNLLFCVICYQQIPVEFNECIFYWVKSVSRLPVYDSLSPKLSFEFFNRNNFHLL